MASPYLNKPKRDLETRVIGAHIIERAVRLILSKQNNVTLTQENIMGWGQGDDGPFLVVQWPKEDENA